MIGGGKKNSWISSRSPCTLAWQRQHSEASVAFKYFVFSHRTLNLRRLIHIYCIYSRSYIKRPKNPTSDKPHKRDCRILGLLHFGVCRIIEFVAY